MIIEGVVHDGHGGDIAIDDISLFDGECTHIVRNGKLISLFLARNLKIKENPLATYLTH